MDRSTTIRQTVTAIGAILALLTAVIAQATPVLIFGLPLGGKLAKSPRVCPWDSDKAKTVCWVGRPFSGKGGYRSGTVHLPDPDGRPAWAAHASFDMTIAGDGLLESVSAKASLEFGTTSQVIVDSISARFGQAVWPTRNSAEWHHPEVHVRMLCSPREWCRVTFESGRSYETRKQISAANDQREANRPKSP